METDGTPSKDNLLRMESVKKMPRPGEGEAF